MTPFASPSDDSSLDFAALLEQSFEHEDVEDVRRGDLLSATVLATDDYGIIVDVGFKRDGVVPRTDFEDLDDFHCQVGDAIRVMVVDTDDRDGNLVVSVKQARASVDWDLAQEQMEEGDVYVGTVVAANRGGLIVPFGELRGFVPASHVVGIPRGLDDEMRIQHLTDHIGQKLEMKIIEVNPRRRRLVLSERLAQRESREDAKIRLLSTLNEGDVVSGTVSSLRDFGAFVDIGGADGLVHVSELAWHRVNHPGEIVAAGDTIDVYVLQLDQERRRIGLSLKRLLPNPWEVIAETHAVGQLVEGIVSRVVSFGAFVELENGIEALLHISELGDAQPERVEDMLGTGDRIVAQVINLEPQRQRMGLSIKHLTADERERFAPNGDAAEALAAEEEEEEAYA